ncbi:Uncharacterized protein DAT39_021163 [Clarias magur]|uniref:Uncharacterized protein n=1 Tax=Clarias magur TaxID=1594786 RepID=A0A8J4T4N2_CLAMG|nr:Uncharacterized protein DAT39_021163 [Clarias magur]
MAVKTSPSATLTLTLDSSLGMQPPLQQGCAGTGPLNLAWLAGDYHLRTPGCHHSLKGRHGAQFRVQKSAERVTYKRGHGMHPLVLKTCRLTPLETDTGELC